MVVDKKNQDTGGNFFVNLAKTKGPKMDHRVFEWFYIDVHQADGHDLVFSLHTRPFMSQFKICIFDVFVYFQNRPVFHRFFAFPQKKMIRKDSSTIEINDRQNLKLKIGLERSSLEFASEEVQIRLELESKKVKGLPLIIDLFGKGTEKSFQWELFMPGAKAKGQIVFGNENQSTEKLAISGTGYFDSNRGNINLKKELAYWLWAKIKFEDELWIAGKVKTLPGKFFNVLVKCTDQKVVVDEQAIIDFKEQTLKIDSVSGNMDLKLNAVKVIDDLRFLVATWPKMFNFPMKIIEILAGIAVQKKSLTWLAGALTNGRYLRKRWLARTGKGDTVEIFGEEMFLNE